MGFEGKRFIQIERDDHIHMKMESGVWIFSTFLFRKKGGGHVVVFNR